MLAKLVKIYDIYQKELNSLSTEYIIQEYQLTIHWWKVGGLT